MKISVATLLTLLLLSTGTALLLSYLALQWYQRFKEQSVGRAHTSLKELFLQMSGASLFGLCLSIGIGLSLLLVMLSHYVLALFPVLAGLAAPKLLISRLKQRRLAVIDSFLPDALIMISGAIRAGAGLQVAIQSFSQDNGGQPLAQEFEVMLAELRLGVSMDEAFMNMNSRIKSPDFFLVTTAVRIARETGGNLSETLERLADTLRQKAIMEGKIKSLTAQGKLQGIIVGALPLLLMFALFQIEPAAMSYLFNSWIGWLTIAIIVILELLGGWMIKKIVTIDI